MIKEKDPNGKEAKEPGSKLDAGKAPVFRGVVSYFPRAIRELARVSEYGAGKYTWRGWESVPDGYNRYSDAMVRHFLAEGAGEVLDPDSGLLTALHTLWNDCARVETMLREMEKEKSSDSA